MPAGQPQVAQRQLGGDRPVGRSIEPGDPGLDERVLELGEDPDPQRQGHHGLPGAEPPLEIRRHAKETVEDRGGGPGISGGRSVRGVSRRRRRGAGRRCRRPARGIEAGPEPLDAAAEAAGVGGRQVGQGPGPRRVAPPRPQVDPEADPGPDLVPRGDAHRVVGVPLDEREGPEVVGPLVVVADPHPAEVLLEDVVLDERPHVREDPYPGPVAAPAQPRAGAQPEQRLVARTGAAEVPGLVGTEAEVDVAGEAALPRLLRGQHLEGGVEPLVVAAEDASSRLRERSQLLPEHQDPRAVGRRGRSRILRPGGAGRRRQRNRQKQSSCSTRYSHATPRIGRMHAA